MVARNAKPDNVKALLVPIMVMRLWPAFLATAGADSWALELAAPNRIVDGPPSTYFQWRFFLLLSAIFWMGSVPTLHIRETHSLLFVSHGLPLLSLFGVYSGAIPMVKPALCQPI